VVEGKTASRARSARRAAGAEGHAVDAATTEAEPCATCAPAVSYQDLDPSCQSTPTLALPVKLILRWLITAAAVWAAAHFVPGIHYSGGIKTLLVVSLIFGLVNALVRPLLKALACAVIVLTLGLAIFIINALMLLLTSYLSHHFGYDFRVDGFVPALVGSVVISLVSWLLSVVLVDDGDERR
jgi:putative membrane protein